MNFMNGMFGTIENGLCRLTMDGSIAIRTNGEYKTYNPSNGTLINCNNFVFDIGKEMFFLIPTNTVEVGDIILASKKPKYVLKVEDNMLTVLNYETGAVENILPERQMFMGNTYFYGKIVSLFGNMTSGVDSANNVMKYMMISQMFEGLNSGSSSNNMNPMFMMMAMSGMSGNIFDGIFGNTKKNEKEVKE